MKKSNFVSLILGTVSGVFFALGMCMALLPEWNAFKLGIAFGSVGIVLGIITVVVWRKMEHKAPIKFNTHVVALCAFGILGALVLGVGMCLCMVWENIILGTVIGLIGIILLISLIPLIKGIK